MYKYIDIAMHIYRYLHTNKQANGETYLYMVKLFILILIRYTVMLKCWNTDVDERLSFKDIVEKLHSSDSQ